MTNPRSRYSTVAIILHWLIAAAIVFQIIIGLQMEDRQGLASFKIFQLHKSIGLTILVLSLVRLGWRLANPPPAYPPHMRGWEKLAATGVHVGLYVIMIGLPLTGWIMVSTSKINIPTLLYGTIPWPHLPGLPGLPSPVKAMWYKFGDVGHHLLILLTFVLLFLHVAAALKHHLLDRDEVLGHMAPGAKPGAWLELRLWAAAIVAVILIAAGVASFGGPKKPSPPAAVAAAPPAAAIPTPAEAAAAAPETAAPAPEAPPPGAAGTPVAWSVDKASSLSFTANWGGAPIEGSFSRWTADILFSPDALAASKIKVSVNVASASTGDQQRDSALPGEDWFDAAKHPTAVFTSDSIRKVSADHYEAKGKLNLRGMSAPVTLPFTLKIAGDAARASGQTTLDRTTFGVGQGEWAATTEIAGPVSVSFKLTAKHK